MNRQTRIDLFVEVIYNYYDSLDTVRQSPYMWSNRETDIVPQIYGSMLAILLMCDVTYSVELASARFMLESDTPITNPKFDPKKHNELKRIIKLMDKEQKLYIKKINDLYSSIPPNTLSAITP